MPILIFLVVVTAITLLTAYICYFRIFRAPKKEQHEEGYIELPKGKIYEAHREQITKWVLSSRALPSREVEIKSHDGLTLRGKYYEHFPDAPIEIMMHGYQGNSERDMNGGIFRSRDCGHNALVVDHRASGRSEGKVISFGINEHRDCLLWIDFILKEINPEAKIILTGVSMGAATVMIASGTDLPKNVIGVLADCGYTSNEDIIKKVIREMKLPADILYPFARLGARIFGKFNLDEFSPIEQVKKSKIPIIFFHGDADDFVPCEMSQRNFDACGTEKKLVIVKGAGHGLAFPYNEEYYLEEANKFFSKIENK